MKSLKVLKAFIKKANTAVKRLRMRQARQQLKLKSTSERFWKAQNGGKNEWLNCVSSKPYFERINKHCILEINDKNGKKSKKLHATRNWAKGDC